MDLSQAPPFLRPDPLSTAVFVLIVAAVALCFVLGLTYAGPRPDPSRGEPPDLRLRWTLGAVAGVSAWLVLTGGVVLTGQLERGWPAVVAYVFGSVTLVVGLAASPVGRRLAMLPLAALVGFQAFRLPLEWVLHAWYVQGTLPVQMTWEGQNFDIVTGGLALLLGLWGVFRPLPEWLVWGFELVGLGLLLNVMRVAITSAPLPVRRFLEDPPVLLPFYLPYTWIVSICVAGALLGHLVLLRRLLGFR